VAAQAAAAAALSVPPPSPTPVPEAGASAPAADAGRDRLLARLLRLLAEPFRRPATAAKSTPAPVAAPNPVPLNESVAAAPKIPPITPEQMAEQLLATVEIDDAALQDLARARADAVRERLLQGTGLDPEP
jgi:hypothetical protein